MYRNTVNDWDEWFEGWQSRDFNCSGFIVILCKVSWNAFLHERSTDIKDEEVLKGQERGKRWGEKRWRFGIYNLAWQNTVTSRHQINLCKCPYISPVCPSMLPNMRPLPCVLASPADATQAQHTSRQKLCSKTDKHFSLLTDRTSTRPSTSMKQERTKRREAHSLVSRFFSFRLLRPSQAFFHSPSLSLSARMKITPSNCLRCKITSVSPPV